MNISGEKERKNVSEIHKKGKIRRTWLVRMEYWFYAEISLEYQQQRFELDVSHCSMLLKVPEKIEVLHGWIVYIFNVLYNNLSIVT